LIFGELEAYIAISCIIGLAISYTSIWAQTLISATSFLVTWQGKNCLNLWADTPPKNNMTMENQLFEDVSPIQNVDFPSSS